MSAGKGDSPRPVDFEKWDKSPLWKNIGKDSTKKKPKTKEK